MSSQDLPLPNETLTGSRFSPVLLPVNRETERALRSSVGGEEAGQDILREVRAVREGVGIADLSHRGKLRITGSERAAWLHGMVSNDVTGLSVGEGNYGTVLTDRGKMVGDYRLIVREEFLLMDTEPEIAETVPKHLNRFLISEDAEIHLDHEAWALFGVFGADSAVVCSRVLGEELPSLPMYGSMEIPYGDSRVIVARQNRTGQRGYDLWLPMKLRASVWKAFEDAGAAAIGEDSVEILRIEAGIPRYGADMNEDIIPLEAQLHHAIHYEKGCYIGQEIVARMHYRGHPNKLLVGFRFEGQRLVAPMTDIFPEPDAEKRVGWVTSATHSPTLNADIGLGYVRLQLAESKETFYARDERGVVPLRIAETPFVVGRD